MAENLTRAMTRRSADGSFTALTLWRGSSGLRSPYFFDWPATIAEVARSVQPHFIVVFLGANDTIELVEQRQHLAFGSPAWELAYRRRVASVLAAAGRIPVVWVALPVMRAIYFASAVRRLNRIFREEVARVPSATFLDVYPAFLGRRGGYDRFVRRPDGHIVSAREADGVHLTGSGGEYLASLVLTHMRTLCPSPR